MAELYNFVWNIKITTNKGNKYTLIIKREDVSIDDARRNIIDYILKLSRYGIPCYVFDDKTKNNYLVFYEPIYNSSNYYIIKSDFLENISKYPDKIQPMSNTTHLNIYAKPFIPRNLY